MSYLNSNQRGLLSTEYLFDIKSFSEYEVFPLYPRGGGNIERPKTSSLSCLKYFIYMSISGIKNLFKLRRIIPPLASNVDLTLSIFHRWKDFPHS